MAGKHVVIVPGKRCRKRKHMCRCVEVLPKRGDTLMWRFPHSEYYKHFVYADFPGGRKVRQTEAYVDFTDPIVVDEVRTAIIDSKMYVAVSFVFGPGLLLWTKYLKENFSWMYKIRCARWTRFGKRGMRFSS